jgi:glutathione S-transferase
VADQCDFDLAAFPSVRAWLKRIEQQPRFVTMDAIPASWDHRAHIAHASQ